MGVGSFITAYFLDVDTLEAIKDWIFTDADRYGV